MRHAFLLGSSLFSLLVASTLAASGCSSTDDDTAAAPAADAGTTRRLSQKGELCQVTNDCVDGLACIPLANSLVGVCSVTQFNIAPTAKECAIVDCREAIDCCPTPPSSCGQWQAQCADAGPGSPLCAQYDAFCKCDTTKRACVADKCVVKCTSDLECATFGPGTTCNSGVCGVGACTADSDCGSGMVCISSSCQPACKSDGDCSGFARCNAGRCEESGCKTDRECVAATRNVEAKCASDGKCVVACESDVECGNPKGYSFVSCIDKRCTYTGCESDKDCRLFNLGAQDVGGAPQARGRQFVCREKK